MTTTSVPTNINDDIRNLMHGTSAVLASVGCKSIKIRRGGYGVRNTMNIVGSLVILSISLYLGYVLMVNILQLQYGGKDAAAWARWTLAGLVVYGVCMGVFGMITTGRDLGKDYVAVLASDSIKISSRQWSKISRTRYKGRVDLREWIVDRYQVTPTIIATIMLGDIKNVTLFDVAIPESEMNRALIMLITGGPGRSHNGARKTGQVQ